MTWRRLIKGIVIQILRCGRDFGLRPMLRRTSRSRFVAQAVRRRAARAMGVGLSDQSWLSSGVNFGTARAEIKQGARIGRGVVFNGLSTISVGEGVEVPSEAQLGRVETSIGGSGLQIYIPTRYCRDDFEVSDTTFGKQA